jgi:hypothetical protein
MSRSIGCSIVAQQSCATYVQYRLKTVTDISTKFAQGFCALRQEISVRRSRRPRARPAALRNPKGLGHHLSPARIFAQENYNGFCAAPQNDL